jgi:hypothetical protein
VVCLKCFGAALSIDDWGMKTLRGIEFGPMHNAASECFAFLSAFRKLAIQV